MWMQKQHPPRPGLVPKSGDPNHPYRWVRPKKYRLSHKERDDAINMAYAISEGSEEAENVVRYLTEGVHPKTPFREESIQKIQNLYRITQSKIRDSDKQIRLFKGLSSYTSKSGGHPIESWTDDPEIAAEFADEGQKVEVAMIPKKYLLADKKTMHLATSYAYDSYFVVLGSAARKDINTKINRLDPDDFWKRYAKQ